MPSYLETLPADILQHIAFLTSSDFTLGPPNNLLALMLTSPRLYQCLNVHTSPHLYADLFRTRFDFSSICCPWRIGLADSVVACHFIQRFRALRRAKSRDMSSVQLCEDLRATLWMAIENNDVNEKYLSSVDFAGYAVELARHCLNGCVKLQDEHEINSLVVCLLCYMFTREKLMATPGEIREELLNLLRPLTCSGSMFRLLYRCNHYTKRQDVYNSRDAKTSPCPLFEQPVNHVARESVLECPALEAQILCPSSAIILTFAIKEIVPLVIPRHLPETRAAALAANRSGPTLVDFQATIRCNTPLFADICAEAEKAPFFAIRDPRARLHDPELHRLVRADSKFSSFQTLPYIPGSLSGVWEGSYLISSSRKPSVNAAADFSCRKPMQCAMSEFLCYSPHQPLPFSADGVFDLSPRRIHVTENGLDTCSKNYCYEKFVSGADPSDTRENHREAVDILLLGETLEEHEQAWGGYRFVGRVRRDGRILFKREPKNTEDDVSGSWYFVGHVRYGSAFVGQWRSSSLPDRVQGIFSMHKTRDTW